MVRSDNGEGCEGLREHLVRRQYSECVMLRVLGPLEVEGPDGPMPVGGPVPRRILCALLVRPGAFFLNYSIPDDGGRWSLQISSNLPNWADSRGLVYNYGTLVEENATNAVRFYRIVYCP